MSDHRVFVCTNQKSGVGDDLAKALKKELKAQGLKSVVLNGEKVHTQVQTCNCLDRCKHCKKGPGAAVVLYPDDVYYNNVQPKDAPRLVQELAARLGL
ncbi:MAG: (2Fe-2S) ferredoxin domain-containing protein [Janthinobacterium lividum]